MGEFEGLIEVKTHYRKVKIIVTLVLFFKGTMFELQPCHYYEGFSQYFYILWKSNARKTTDFYFI